MNRYYVYRTGEAGDTFDADYELDALGLWCKFDEAAYVIAQRDARIAELEAAIDKLAQCKGRFHTETNFNALIEVADKSLHK